MECGNTGTLINRRILPRMEWNCEYDLGSEKWEEKSFLLPISKGSSRLKKENPQLENKQEVGTQRSPNQILQKYQ